jgi:hypothetical protein
MVIYQQYNAISVVGVVVILLVASDDGLFVLYSRFCQKQHQTFRKGISIGFEEERMESVLYLELRVQISIAKFEEYLEYQRWAASKSSRLSVVDIAFIRNSLIGPSVWIGTSLSVFARRDGRLSLCSSTFNTTRSFAYLLR